MRQPKNNYLYSVITVVLAFSVLFFNSCKDKDDPKPHLGTWVFTKSEYANCDDPDNNGTQNYPCSSTECQKFIITSGGITLNSVSALGTYNYSGTYTMQGDRITICINLGGGNQCTEGIFTITGNTMIIVVEEADEGCTETITFNKE